MINKQLTAIVLAAAFFLAACSTAPKAPEKQVLLIPKSFYLEVKDNTPSTQIPIGKIDLKYIEIRGMESRVVEEKINKKIRNVVGMEEAYSGNEDVTSLVKTSELTKQYLHFMAETYRYMHGGANGQSSIYSYYFDLYTGDVIRFKQLFIDDYKEVVNRLALQWLAEQDYSHEFTSVSDEQCYYIKGEYLYLCFSEYEIAAGAEGIINIPIAKSDLQSIAKPNGLLQ